LIKRKPSFSGKMLRLRLRQVLLY